MPTILVNATAGAPEQVLLWPDGVPGDHDPQNLPHLDIYRPLAPLKPAAPPIVLVPGGGYGGLSAQDGDPFARYLNRLGYWVAVVSYRVKPFGFPAPYADACRAIRMTRSWAAKELFLADRLVLMGFSAGGHLAATIGTQPELHREPSDALAATYSARPDGLVLVYPVISFCDWAHEGSCENLLGANAPIQLRQRLSADLHVDEKTPPTILFHANFDNAVPVQNSLRFVDACVRHGVPAELLVFPRDYHGIGPNEPEPAIAVWTVVLENWLKRFQKSD